MSFVHGCNCEGCCNHSNTYSGCTLDRITLDIDGECENKLIIDDESEEK